MNTTTANADKYFDMLADLKPDVKMDLIQKLTASLKSDDQPLPEAKAKNPLQEKILAHLDRKPKTEDLEAIQSLIAHYYAEKAMRLADKVWDEKGWTHEDSARLAHTHMRTPYRPKNSLKAQ